jgi:hypothetical protein
MKTEIITWINPKDEPPPESITVLLCFRDRSVPVLYGYRRGKQWHAVQRHQLESKEFVQEIIGWAYPPTGECLRRKAKVAS